MIDYLLEYLSNTEFNYLEEKLNSKIKDLLILNKKNIIPNLDFLYMMDLDIFEIINKRPDLIICDLESLKERINKVEYLIREINVEDFILFGI